MRKPTAEVEPLHHPAERLVFEDFGFSERQRSIVAPRGSWPRTSVQLRRRPPELAVVTCAFLPSPPAFHAGRFPWFGTVSTTNSIAGDVDDEPGSSGAANSGLCSRVHVVSSPSHAGRLQLNYNIAHYGGIVRADTMPVCLADESFVRPRGTEQRGRERLTHSNRSGFLNGNPAPMPTNIAIPNAELLQAADCVVPRSAGRRRVAHKSSTASPLSLTDSAVFLVNDTLYVPPIERRSEEETTQKRVQQPQPRWPTHRSSICCSGLRTDLVRKL